MIEHVLHFNKDKINKPSVERVEMGLKRGSLNEKPKGKSKAPHISHKGSISFVQGYTYWAWREERTGVESDGRVPY